MTDERGATLSERVLILARGRRGLDHDRELMEQAAHALRDAEIAEERRPWLDRGMTRFLAGALCGFLAGTWSTRRRYRLHA